MVGIYETMPREKMPDEEELSHVHHVCLRMDFERNHYDWGSEFFGDLTEYYEWAGYQDIKKMEHNIMILGHEDANKSANVLIMFTFLTVGDAVAFKLMWK